MASKVDPSLTLQVLVAERWLELAKLANVLTCQSSLFLESYSSTKLRNLEISKLEGIYVQKGKNASTAEVDESNREDR